MTLEEKTYEIIFKITRWLQIWLQLKKILLQSFKICKLYN